MKLSGLRSKKRGADDDGQQLPTSAAGSSRLSIGSGAQLPDTAPPVPAEATPIAPAQMGQKRVACPQCGVVNLVDAHVPRLRCGHCHLELSALGGSTQSSVQVLCGWCKTPRQHHEPADGRGDESSESHCNKSGRGGHQKSDSRIFAGSPSKL
eukprot:gnl/TRDRNA2_/TRDRNA2_127731_c0_seq1.p1 gnl/TRDRNA2_/TRDRNA2_127731_c0~~gnl/TRDRNA2_/TRDRNA2_127731_c0_seq1.p1  ORF type:complete len:153 (+),score=25.48 gnl/TRDRNA2_/TRDRNA2_127731_c0_seq1:55-513(+)